MSTLRQAAQQALAALEDACGGRCNAEYNPCFQREVATALRAALAEPQTTHWEGCEAVHPECKTEQEPVAWISEGGDVSRSRRYMDEMGFKCEPLYTAPTPRKPLTDEEIVEISAATQGLSDFDFARAIERAHGITGETNE